MEAAVAHTYGDDIVRNAAALFVAHAESLLDQGGPMVLICAPPKEILAAVDEPPSRRPDPSEQELDEGSDSPQADRGRLIPFHVDALGGTPAEAWTSAEALGPLKDFDVPLAELKKLAAAGAPEYGNYVMHWYDQYDIGVKGN